MKLNLLKSTYLSYFISGAGWLIFGILSVFDDAVLNFIASVFFFIGVLSGIKIKNSSIENEDEMSEQNLIKAKAATLDILRFVVCFLLIFIIVISLISKIIPKVNEIVDVNITFVFAMIFTFIQFSVGVHFFKFEKDGE